MKENNNKYIAQLLTFSTIAFMLLSIYNIWETRKYRKLEYDLKKKEYENKN